MHSVTQSPPAEDDLASLDRGVIEAGLIAAKAMAAIQALERRVAVLEAELQNAYETLGRALGIPPPVLPASQVARERWHMTGA